MPTVTWDTLYEEDAACPKCGSTHLLHRTLREHEEHYRKGKMTALYATTEDAELVVLAVDCGDCGEEILNRYTEGLEAIANVLYELTTGKGNTP